MAKKTLLKMSSSMMRSVGNFKGKHFLSRQISRALASPAQPFLIQRGGVNFAIDGADIIEHELLFSGNYGTNVHFGLRLIKPQKDEFVFWDIGANIGSVTLPFANQNPKATICCFEPSPPVLSKLSRNISANPALQESIKCYNLALSNAVGPAPFFTSNEVHNSGVGGLGQDLNRNACPIYVHSVSAEGLITEGICPAPELMKIDVEGWELEVLKGFGEVLKGDQAPNILFEHSPYRLESQDKNKFAVPNYLTERGYHLSIIHADTTVEPFTSEQADVSCDVLASKTLTTEALIALAQEINLSS